MKILVEDFNVNNNTVVFSSHYGKCIALWEGLAPNRNSYYDVELEIPEILVWGKDIKKAKVTSYNIMSKNGISYFVGKLESADEDGCSVVRIGDSIVLLETEGIPLEIGAYVSFNSKKATLYNSDM
jgi:hypothetical protein